MNADQIRNEVLKSVEKMRFSTGGTIDQEGYIEVHKLTTLGEIAAQLAEINEHLRLMSMTVYRTDPEKGSIGVVGMGKAIDTQSPSKPASKEGGS